MWSVLQCKHGKYISCPKDFKANDGATYTPKWVSLLDKLQVVESDYHADIWDHIVVRGGL